MHCCRTQDVLFHVEDIKGPTTFRKVLWAARAYTLATCEICALNFCDHLSHACLQRRQPEKLNVKGLKTVWCAPPLVQLYPMSYHAG